MAVRLGAAGALALAAASVGVVVPTLEQLVAQTGHGSTAAGVFMAAHVLGGVAAAAFGARALRRAGSARALAAAGLTTSVLITLAMAAVDSLEARIALRFLDGACHLIALTSLIAALTGGDAVRRARSAVMMGLTIVLGIGAGLGIGAVLTLIGSTIAGLSHAEQSLVVSALLSGAALLVVLGFVAAEPPPVEAPRSRERGPIAPGLLAFGDRFVFGTLTVAMPFLGSPRRVSIVLGMFMTASICAFPLARRYAVAWGPRRLAVRSGVAAAVALAVAAADVFAALPVVLIWAIVAGGAAGAVYASALVLAARSTELEGRVRDMATLHAAGGAGFALGNLSAGALRALLPGPLAVAVPCAVVLALATLGVWLTVPGGRGARPEPVRGGEAGHQPVT
jgi:MFS family permease